MTPTEQLELLMQRAVDGELCVGQRHDLMQLAERQPDGWRQLACTFLEEQIVSQTIRQAPLVSPLAEESIVQPAHRPTGFWYHHPVLTTAVTICVAFVLGLTVPWNRNAEEQSASRVHLVGDSVNADSVRRESPVDAEMRQMLRRWLESFDKPLPGK